MCTLSSNVVECSWEARGTNCIEYSPRRIGSSLTHSMKKLPSRSSDQANYTTWVFLLRDQYAVT